MVSSTQQVIMSVVLRLCWLTVPFVSSVTALTLATSRPNLRGVDQVRLVSGELWDQLMVVTPFQVISNTSQTGSFRTYKAGDVIVFRFFMRDELQAHRAFCLRSVDGRRTVTRK